MNSGRERDKDVKRFLFKLSIFLFLPLVWIIASVNSLLNEPIDINQIRSWESLSVLEKNAFLKGPFYPYMTLHKIEQGDTPHPKRLAVAKDVIWKTDRYGYRKEDKGMDKYDVVIIGDSQTAGSTLTQNDMLTEKLEKDLGLTTYPYAPSNILFYAQDERFQKNPPKIVVLASAEKLFMNIPDVEGVKSASFIDQYLSPLAANKWVINMAVIFDRLKKKYFVDYFRAMIWRLPEDIKHLMAISQGQQAKVAKSGDVNLGPVVVSPQEVREGETNNINLALDGSMVFSLQSDDAYIEVTDSELYWQVQKMLHYQKYFKSQGVRFIIMPIPNKENIYWEKVPRGKHPTTIPQFIEKAREVGLEVVDLQTPFEKFHQENPEELLYNIDDTHWNARGAEMAASILAEEIKKK